MIRVTSEKRIDLIIKRIQKIYFVVAVLFFSLLLIIGFATSEELQTFNIKKALEALLLLSICLAIYLGLRSRSHWGGSANTLYICNNIYFIRITAIYLPSY